MKIAALIAALLLPVAAQAFSLQWPLDCTLGKDCFIQNFIDHDPSAGMEDFACNRATYDGHDGTDIRLRNLAAMRGHVAVKAAADGVVLGARNNVPDISIRTAGAPDAKGHECGNGVHLQHAQGYRTQYCHMMNGSIRVHTGQQVKTGDVLGYVGLSGQTEFPHMHIGVWKDGVLVDPFTSGPISAKCNPSVSAAHGLWAVPVPYEPSAILNDGFADAAPDRERMRDTPVSPTTMPVNAPALLYWVDVMNVQAGDQFNIAVTAPDGSVFAQKSTAIEKPQALNFSFIGKKNSAGKLAVGTYRAKAELVRGGVSVASSARSVEVK